MKKTNYLYILLILLLIVAGYLVAQNRSGGRIADEFSVKDTAGIEFISIESADQNVVLTKNGQTWKVNNLFSAGPEKVRGLLILLSRIKITGAVQTATSEDIGNAMDRYGRKIIIADSKRVIRSFTVYHDTIYSDYTYMMHENGNTLYRVEVPGVKYSNLAVLFRPDPVFWKSNILFQYRPEDIVYVFCCFPETPEQSFRLVNEEGTRLKIFSYPDSSELGNVDEEMAWRYLSYFSRVFVDEYTGNPDLDLPEEFRGDNPDVKLQVTDINGNVTEIDSYTAYYYDDDGGVHVNLDEVFLWINGRDWARMKYINLDPVAKQKDYFISE